MADKLNPSKIFISYTRKDVGRVNELYVKLRGLGYSPWIDTQDLIGGTPWLKAIIKAIRQSGFFLACLSNNSVDKKTGVLVREINEAFEEAKNRRSESIFIIPVRLEECKVPEEFEEIQWVDLFASDGFDRLTKALRHGLNRLGIDAPLILRSEPILNLSPADAAAMIKARNFYDRTYWHGEGIQHEYEPKTINGDRVVVDHTTGLTWLQSGSKETMDYEAAQKYIAKLNKQSFAGYNDWRLPTLEEAMSLMEPSINETTTLYINPILAPEPYWIWAADQGSTHRAWCALFNFGNCYLSHVSHDDIVRVRAVRSGTID
jgi:hypothetical protein